MLSLTSQYWPGCSVPLIAVLPLLKLPGPVALAYWMDHPLTVTALEPALNSST